MEGGEDDYADGTHFFKVSPDDVLNFPELTGVYGVALREDDTGFVHTSVLSTGEDYGRAVEAAERQDSDAQEEEEQADNDALDSHLDSDSDPETDKIVGVDIKALRQVLRDMEASADFHDDDTNTVTISLASLDALRDLAGGC